MPMAKNPTTHVNATTTPEMRAFIHESDLPTAQLARLLRISEATVRKWRKRSSQDDVSHRPKNMKTSLSPTQEYVVLELRQRLLLSLDELVRVCHEFIHPTVSRAALQRCLQRHGLSRLADMDGNDIDEAPAVEVEIIDAHNQQPRFSAVSPQAMKDVLGSDDLGDVVNVSVTQLPSLAGSKAQQRLLLATDPESRWVYVDIYDGDEKDAASRYITHVLTKAPFHIRRILAGNYNEFLTRFRMPE